MFKLCAGNRNTHKEGKLVRILARSGHLDRARPVVVEVGLRVPWFTECVTRKKSYLKKMLQ